MIVFEPNKTQFSEAAKETMKAAALALARYPSESMVVVGYASVDEADAATLAQRRALGVTGYLINNYEADPRRLSPTSTADPAGSPAVELILGREHAKPSSSKQAKKIR